MMQVPEKLQQAASMKMECEHELKAEQMRGLPIEDIIKEQNMPRLVERWAESKFHVFVSLSCGSSLLLSFQHC